MRTPVVFVAAVVGLVLVSCAEPAGSSIEAAADPAPHGGGQNSLQRVLERGVLRVGTTGDFYMSFLDPETGERSGYDIDLTRKLAEDMGVGIEYVATDWSSLVSGLASGRYDITTGASFNPGRARAASYTVPIARTGTVAIIRRADADRFQSWEEINRPGVRVATRHGSVFEYQARDITPDAQIRVVASPGTEYQEVLVRRADVAIASLFDAASIVRDQPELQIAPVDLRNTTYIGILVPQGDHDLRSFIDSWIRAQEYSGFIDELTERWNLAF